MRRAITVSVHTATGIMACKFALFTTALFLVIALSLAAPAAEEIRPEAQVNAEEKSDGDLKTSASHWGGFGGHYGWGGHYGGYGYPHYGYWGWPSYGYGYGYGWPYGGYGHHGGYWW